MLLVLFALIAGMWYWQSRASGTNHPEVDYSVFYQWLTDYKIQSVLIQGSSLEGELNAAEAVDEQSIAQFHTVLPDDDAALLPLLREKNVGIRVAQAEQPFALELVFTLLPWILIIGFWLWMSSRAQTMMGAGGPMGGILKTPSRKFDKSTSVNVTFNDWSESATPMDRNEAGIWSTRLELPPGHHE